MIPDMNKLGIEIIAITLVALEHQINPKKECENLENS